MGKFQKRTNMKKSIIALFAAATMVAGESIEGIPLPSKSNTAWMAGRTKWSSGVLTPDSTIYALPDAEDEVLKINTHTSSSSLLRIPSLRSWRNVFS